MAGERAPADAKLQTLRRVAFRCWNVEILFRSRKQVMDIEAPQHWCQESVEKVAPGGGRSGS